MAGRRRRKFTWLPTQGTNANGDPNAGFASSFLVSELTVENVPAGDFLGPAANVVFPFINDFPQEENLGSSTEGIGEIIGNEYLIERIVGKIFVGKAVGFASSGLATILVKCGIFIARSEGTAQGGPIGLNEVNYGPATLNTQREPWMFMRTWVLGGTSQSTNGFASSSEFQRYNFMMGAGASMFEGPHVDVRSVRRVRQDERAFITFSATGFNPRADSTTTTNGTVDIVTDLRVLGALRKARNRSSF